MLPALAAVPGTGRSAGLGPAVSELGTFPLGRKRAATEQMVLRNWHLLCVSAGNFASA